MRKSEYTFDYRFHGQYNRELFPFSPESDAEEGASTSAPSQKPEPTVEKKVPEDKETKEESTTTILAKSSDDSTNKKQKKRNRNRKKNKTTPESSEVKKPVKGESGGRAKKPFVRVNQRQFQQRRNIKELNKKDATHISENRLRALGINPKKYQNKLIYGDKE